MPKNTRKKKLKEEDFRKQKLKVGKKKPVADNVTVTTFKAKSIILPGQSITLDKTGQVTNARHQTVNELISLLKHYNAGSRRDALVGLRDIFRMHPSLVAQTMSSAVSILAKLLMDDDDTVRKTLFAFFEEFLPMLNKPELAPLLPVLIVYTRSAMTHLDETIRASSLQFLDLWIQLAPEFVVAQRHSLLPNYLSLLNGNIRPVGTHGMSSAKNKVFVNPKSMLGSQKARITVLGSMYRLLEAAAQVAIAELAQDPFWFFSSKLSRYSQTQTTAPKIAWTDGARAANALLNAPDSLHQQLETSLRTRLDLFSTAQLSDANADPLEQNKTESSELLTILGELRPFLLAIWLEASPNVFSSGGNIQASDSLEAMHLILRVLRILWRTLFGGTQPTKVTESWADEHMRALLQHLALHFPYGEDTYQTRDQRAEYLLQDMNAAFCELTSLYLLMQDMGAIERNGARPTSSASPPWVGRMVEYLFSVLGWTSRSSTTVTAPDLCPEHFTAMLPSIWTLLNCLEAEDRANLFQAVVEYGERCRVNTPLRHTCVAFLARVLAVESHPHYIGTFRILPQSREADSLRHWLLSMPKMLWHLKTSRPEITAAILRTLRDVAQRHSEHGPLDREFFLLLQANMAPFFHVTLPNKGPIFGPFLGLPEHVQRIAVELMYYLGKPIGRVQQAVAACLAEERLKPPIKNYMTELLLPTAATC